MATDFERHDDNLKNSCAGVTIRHYKHFNESVEDTNQNQVDTQITNGHELEAHDVLRQQCTGKTGNCQNNGGLPLEKTVLGRSNGHNVEYCDVNVNHDGELKRDVTQSGLLQVENNEKPGIVNIEEKQYRVERIGTDKSPRWQGINLYDNETRGIRPGFSVDTLEKREDRNGSDELTVSNGTSGHTTGDTQSICVSQNHDNTSITGHKSELLKQAAIFLELGYLSQALLMLDGFL